MTVRPTVKWMALGGAALAVLGCDVFLGGRAREEPVYVEPRPVYVEPQPQAVIVEQGPPVIEERPFPGDDRDRGRGR